MFLELNVKLNINVRKKVTLNLKTINDKKGDFISLNPKPNDPSIYLKHILGKSLEQGNVT